MTLDNIEDKDSVIIVTLPDTKTKKERIFTITNGTTNNIGIYRKYLKLRPLSTPHNRLFVNYKSSKCTIQVVGINTFSKLPSLIAEYLQLPEVKLFTGHCFRRTSASILVNEGGDILSLKRHGGWRSSSVAESYVDDAISNKISVANKILGEIRANSLNEQMCNSSTSTHANAVNFNEEGEGSIQLGNEMQRSNATMCEINMQENKHITTNIPHVHFGTLNNCTINLYPPK